jgi:hypothetical protein
MEAVGCTEMRIRCGRNYKFMFKPGCDTILLWLARLFPMIAGGILDVYACV